MTLTYELTQKDLIDFELYYGWTKQVAMRKKLQIIYMALFLLLTIFSFLIKASWELKILFLSCFIFMFFLNKISKVILQNSLETRYQQGYRKNLAGTFTIECRDQYIYKKDLYGECTQQYIGFTGIELSEEHLFLESGEMVVWAQIGYGSFESKETCLAFINLILHKTGLPLESVEPMMEYFRKKELSFSK